MAIEGDKGPIIEEAVAQASKIEGWMNTADLYWLAREASRRKQIVEIGSWLGRSTKALAVATPGRVFAVDQWQGTEGEIDRWYKLLRTIGQVGVFRAFSDNLKNEIKAEKCMPLVMDSMSAVKWFQKELGPGRPDMVFIDGNHTYDFVRNDIQFWKPLISPGGIISGHDYDGDNYSGVVRAVNEFFPQRKVNAGGYIWYVELP